MREQSANTEMWTGEGAVAENDPTSGRHVTLAEATTTAAESPPFHTPDTPTHRGGISLAIKSNEIYEPLATYNTWKPHVGTCRSPHTSLSRPKPRPTQPRHKRRHQLPRAGSRTAREERSRREKGCVHRAWGSERRSTAHSHICAEAHLYMERNTHRPGGWAHLQSRRETKVLGPWQQRTHICPAYLRVRVRRARQQRRPTGSPTPAGCGPRLRRATGE
jgi:hypothetical protein